MSLSKFTKFFLVALVSVLLTSVAEAGNPYCGEILQHGIYDESNFLDVKSRYSLAKKVHCSSEVSESDKEGDISGNIGFDGFKVGGTTSGKEAKRESFEFCKSTYDQYRNNSRFNVAIKKINAGVVSAWSECVSELKTGFSHHITPTSDHGTFTYKIQYFSDGFPFEVALKRWDIKNGICTNPPKRGDLISNSAPNRICTRKSKDQVVIVADAPTGITYLKPIVLQGYVPDKPKVGERVEWISTSSSSCRTKAAYLKNYSGVAKWSTIGEKLIGSTNDKTVGFLFLVCTYELNHKVDHIHVGWEQGEYDLGEHTGTGGGYGVLVYRDDIGPTGPFGNAYGNVIDRKITHKSNKSDHRINGILGQNNKLFDLGKETRTVTVAIYTADSWAGESTSLELIRPYVLIPGEH